MKRRGFYALAGGVGAATVVVLALVFGVISGASSAEADSAAKTSGSQMGVQSTDTLPPGGTSAETASSLSSGAVPDGAASGATSGPGEGIKVHGHWLIEVRELDGSVVTRKEFENDLRGASPLVWMLTRRYTFGLWNIRVGATFTPCFGTCLILEPNDPTGDGPIYFKNLAVATEGGETTVVLGGTLVAQGPGSISTVGTSMRLCSNTVTPQVCASGTAAIASNELFTLHTLDSPVAVQAGQQVLVKVTLSFS